jgi:hypothetical protein
MEHLWPKYLQAFLNEMAADLKSKRLVLADDEFYDMPESWLDNLDDYALFEDYLTSDLQIEVCRAIKFRTVQMLVEKQTPLSDALDKLEDRLETRLDRRQKEIVYLNKIVETDFLKNDESIVYNGILNRLKPGQKWAKQDTQTYLDSVFTTWPDDIETLETDLEGYRAALLRTMRSEKQELKSKIDKILS